MFKCEECTYSTASDRRFRSHRAIAHPEAYAKKRAYRCLTCAVDFRSKKEATSHRRTTSHKERVRVNKDPASCVVGCPFCSNTLQNKTELRDHVWKHHIELAPQCPLCGHQFATSADLAAHAKAGFVSEHQQFFCHVVTTIQEIRFFISKSNAIFPY